MAAGILNRTTLEYTRSPSGDNFDTNVYVVDPDMSPVDGVSTKYWLLTGDVLSVMDQAAQDAVDAVETTDRLDAISDRLDDSEDIQRAFARLVMDELNILRANDSLAPRTLSQLKTGLRNKLGT